MTGEGYLRRTNLRQELSTIPPAPNRLTVQFDGSFAGLHFYPECSETRVLKTVQVPFQALHRQTIQKVPAWAALSNVLTILDIQQPPVQ